MARKFGVEIEFLVPYNTSMSDFIQALCDAGVPAYDAGYTHSVTRRWKIVTDASVADTNMYGYELVSPPLESTEESFEQIRKACAVLSQFNAKVKKCCGLHVHVDASELNVDTAKAFLNRYAKYEAEIDTFMPQSRRGDNNTYCRSVIGRIYQSENRYIDGLMNDRYYKVNVKSYVKYNTMEFRQHSGTTNAEKIINWVKFCIAFYEKSAVAAFQEVVETGTSQVSITLPYAIREVSYARSMTPEEGYRMIGATNHRKVNSIIRAATYIYQNWDAYWAEGSYFRMRKLKEVIAERTRDTYVDELRDVVRNLAGLDLVFSDDRNTRLAFGDLINTLQFWREVYSPLHGYSRNVVRGNTPTVRRVPVEVIDNGLWDGIPAPIAQFYQERAMELAA